MTSNRAIRKYMIAELENDPDRYDNSGGEINNTLLAENANCEFDDLDLDDELAPVWEIAFEVSTKYENRG